MNATTLLVLFGATFLGVSSAHLRAAPPDLTKPSGQKYDVPLLEYPAFLDAVAANGDGVRTLLRPVSEMEFGRSLGAQYWTPGNTGWPAMLAGEDAAGINGAELAKDSIASDPGIFGWTSMGSGAAIPDVSAEKPDNPHEMTGDAGLFSESAQQPGMIDPRGPPGWAIDSGLGSSGGVTGGVFLILALFGLLFSQLRGFEKKGRRRRSSSRRRP